MAEYNHRVPPGYGCVYPPPQINQCQSHYRSGEKKLYYGENAGWNDSTNTPNSGEFCIFENSYSIQKSGGEPTTRSIATCNKRGWKAAIAGKSWHGTIGFNNTEGTYDSCVTNNLQNGDYECCYESNKQTATPPQTRYLRIDIEGESRIDYIYGPPSESYSTYNSASVVAWSEVNRYTGLLSSSYTQLSSSNTEAATGETCISLLTEYINELLDLFGEDHTAKSGQHWIDENTPYHECDMVYGLSTKNKWNFSGLSWQWACGMASVHVNAAATTTMSDDEIVAERTYEGTGESGPYFSMNVTITLSSPYTAQNVQDEVDTLLGYWDLQDDITHDWRTDRLFDYCPYPHYLEREKGIDPKSKILTTFSETQVDKDYYTGEIIGKPLPNTMEMSSSVFSSSMYDYYYDKYHLNYYSNIDYIDGPCATYPGHCNWKLKGSDLDEVTEGTSGSWCRLKGATSCTPDLLTLLEEGEPVGIRLSSCYSNGYGLEDRVSPIRFPGAFRMWNVADNPKGNVLVVNANPRLWARKWAEVLEFKKPSMNWQRPCSASYHYDELTRDPTTQNCDNDGGSYDDIVYERSGSNFLPGCADTTGDNLVNPCGDLRWSDLSPCSDDPFWDDEGKKYEFVKLQWNYNYRNSGEWERIIEQSSSLTGMSPGCYRGYLISPPTYQWYDMYALPTMSAAVPNARELESMTSTDDYVTYTPCKPNIVLIQPTSNSTSSNCNVKLYSLPQFSGIDYRYGNKVIVWVSQFMTDPTWNRPAEPCLCKEGLGIGDEGADVPCLWYEDVGAHISTQTTCEVHIPCTWYDINIANQDSNGLLNVDDTPMAVCDSYNYAYLRMYPMRPLVESRTNMMDDYCTEKENPFSRAGMRSMVQCNQYIYDINIDAGCYEAAKWNDESASLFCEQCIPPKPIYFADGDTWVPSSGHVMADIYENTIYDVTMQGTIPNTYLPWEIQAKQEAAIGGRFGEYYRANGGESLVMLMP